MTFQELFSNDDILLIEGRRGAASCEWMSINNVHDYIYESFYNCRQVCFCLNESKSCLPTLPLQEKIPLQRICSKCHVKCQFYFRTIKYDASKDGIKFQFAFLYQVLNQAKYQELRGI